MNKRLSTALKLMLRASGMVTPKEMSEFRRLLRLRVKDNETRMAAVGCRVIRKPRAKVKREMRRATAVEFAEALGLRRRGVAMHMIEQRFTLRRIKITRHDISEAMGAKP